MTIRIVILVLHVILVGCNPSGPTSTKSTSTAFATLAERTKFFNEYVTFRRTYKTLDFDIAYQNNAGGLVPGPSDWDMRLIATVPASELQDWVPPGVNVSNATDIAWLESVPTKLNMSGVSEWYVDGKRIVGIDRVKQIVVYRSSSMSD